MEIPAENVIKHLSNLVAQQAQEIAVLRAQIEILQESLNTKE